MSKMTVIKDDERAPIKSVPYGKLETGSLFRYEADQDPTNVYMKTDILSDPFVTPIRTKHYVLLKSGASYTDLNDAIPVIPVRATLHVHGDEL